MYSPIVIKLTIRQKHWNHMKKREKPCFCTNEFKGILNVFIVPRYVSAFLIEETMIGIGPNEDRCY